MDTAFRSWTESTTASRMSKLVSIAVVNFNFSSMFIVQERIFQKSQIPIRPQGMTGQQREEEELEAVVGDPRPEITSEPSHNKNNASGKGANGDVGGIHNN